MKYPINWGEEKAIRRLFVYQTKYLEGPFFGNCSISHYQTTQHEIYQKILKGLKMFGLESADVITCQGDIYINMKMFCSVKQFRNLKS